jgi:hypothetical protein
MFTAVGLLAVGAGAGAGLVSASPPRPAQPVGAVGNGGGDERGEQVLDLVAGQRDEAQRWWVVGGGRAEWPRPINSGRLVRSPAPALTSQVTNSGWSTRQPQAPRCLLVIVGGQWSHPADQRISTVISRSWPSRLCTTMPKPLSTGCSRSGAEPTVDLLPERRTVNPLNVPARYSLLYSSRSALQAAGTTHAARASHG